MAMSGQVRTYEVDDGTYFYVDWSARTRTSENTNGNYDDIDWTVNVHCAWNYESGGIQSYGMAIENVDVYGGMISEEYFSMGDHELASGTTRVYHNNDGTKTFNIRTSGLVYEGGETYGSQDFTLDPINRFAITNSVSGSDIERNFSVNYTKYVSTYNYKLRISIPNIIMLERINYNTNNETFTLSQASINTLFNYFNEKSKLNNDGTFNLGFAVETWSTDDNTKLSDGNEKIISCKITNADPIFDNFEFNDINSTTLALTGNSKYNINGYSTIRATISTANKAVAQKGATMNKYQLVIGNTTREANYDENNNVNIDIPNASIGEYKVYAIDSRENNTSVTKLATRSIEYKSIYINLDPYKTYLERDSSGVGENVTLHYEGTIWNDSFGSVTNSIKSVKYEYKATDSNTWITESDFIREGITQTDITPTITNDTFTFNHQIISIETGGIFDVQKSYNFRIIIEDELTTYIANVTPLPSGIPNISLNSDGVGIMCDYNPILGGALQVNGEVFKNGGYVEASSAYGKAYKFPDGLMICRMRYRINTKIDYAWGNLYVCSSAKTLPNFVEEFIDVPVVCLTSDGAENSWVMSYGSPTKTTPQNIFLVRGTARTSYDDYYVNILAIGKWK